VGTGLNHVLGSRDGFFEDWRWALIVLLQSSGSREVSFRAKTPLPRYYG
jgi:hypothetical protein